MPCVARPRSINSSHTPCPINKPPSTESSHQQIRRSAATLGCKYGGCGGGQPGSRSRQSCHLQHGRPARRPGGGHGDPQVCRERHPGRNLVSVSFTLRFVCPLIFLGIFPCIQCSKSSWTPRRVCFKTGNSLHAPFEFGVGARCSSIPTWHLEGRQF